MENLNQASTDREQSTSVGRHNEMVNQHLIDKNEFELKDRQRVNYLVNQISKDREQRMSTCEENDISIEKQASIERDNITLKARQEVRSMINQASSDREQSTSTGGNADMPNGQLSGGSKFQSAVRRHLGKDRLFHLVTTLLKSIEEENNAQKDLMMSFTTARNIPIDIPTSSTTNIDRPKRRRKKMEIPLIERIELQRKAKLFSSEKITTEEPKPPELIGNLEFHANNSEQDRADTTNVLEVSANCDYKGDEDHNNIPNKTSPIINRPVIFSSGTGDVTAECDVTSKPVIQEKVTLDGHKPRNIQRAALHSEKAAVIDHFRNNDDNFDLDKLVLKSVLENTHLVQNSDQNKNGAKKKETEHADEDKITDNNSRNQCDAIVKVDSDSDDESHIDVKGNVDDLEDSNDLIDTEEHDSDKFAGAPIRYHTRFDEDDQFGKFLATTQHVTNSEYSRLPSTMMKPSLNTISEAEHSATSFNSLYGKSSDSIIEIETSRNTLNKLNRPVHISEIKIQEHKDDLTMDEPREKHKTRFNESWDNDGVGVIKSNSTLLEGHRRLLCIDLVGVYESNADLQNINFGKSKKQANPKFKVQNQAVFSKKKKQLTFRSNSQNDTMKEWILPTKPLPPYPRSFNSIKHSSLSPRNDENSTTSSDEQVEQFRSYALRKDSERYSKPDVVLWSHINILNANSHNAQSRKAGRHKSAAMLALQDRPMFSRNTSGTRSSTRGKHNSKLTTEFRMLAMPLKESVKGVGQADKSKVPPLTTLYDTRPRQNRVQQLYTNFQEDRTKDGHRQCKYLELSPR